jgi:hypothetical protein
MALNMNEPHRHSNPSEAMPLELQIFRASEFVRLGAQGQLDLSASYAALVTLAKACIVRQINRALLDVREIRTNLTPDDLAALVRAFDDLGFTADHKLAVLHRGDQDYRARLFAMIGRLRGWDVQAFENFEGAVHWLSQPSAPAQPAAEPEQFTVPVKQQTNPPPAPNSE